jgi:cystathionine gamma-synthase
LDNTFATLINQRPLALRADMAVHSVTKFLCRHSSLLGAVTVCDANLLAALRQAREFAGATPGTLESFLAARGVGTSLLALTGKVRAGTWSDLCTKGTPLIRAQAPLSGDSK